MNHDSSFIKSVYYYLLLMFFFLVCSAPVLSKGTSKSPISTSSIDNSVTSSSNSWRNYTQNEHMNMDHDTTSLGVATPFLKSFMQVGRSRSSSRAKS